MLIIKMLLLCSIFGASALGGNIIGNRYQKRTTELCEIKKALNYFETKIMYTYEPLKNIFFEISNLVNNEIGNLFKIAGIKLDELTAEKAWEYSLEIAETDFNQKDLNIIKDFRKDIRTN